METWNQICARLSKLHFTCSEDYFDKQIVFQRVLSKFIFSLRPKTFSTLGQRQSAGSPKLDLKSWDEHLCFFKFSKKVNEHRFELESNWQNSGKKITILCGRFCSYIVKNKTKKYKQTPEYFSLSKLIEASS